jgi:Protein of unknown function (DUF2423)
VKICLHDDDKDEDDKGVRMAVRKNEVEAIQAIPCRSQPNKNLHLTPYHHHSRPLASNSLNQSINQKQKNKTKKQKQMAKSTRSKTKRSFRRAKREEFEKSTYAVTHAARLERLSRKLAIIAQAPTSQAVLSNDNTSSENSQQRGEGGGEIVEGEEDEQGWPLFALLGLVDPDEIAAFGLPLSSSSSSSSSSKRGRRRPSSSSSESDSDADWIRGLSAVAWRHLSESALLGSFS